MYTSFIGLSIDLEHEERIIDSLVNMENVIEVYTMMGPFELFVKVRGQHQKLEATIARYRPCRASSGPSISWPYSRKKDGYCVLECRREQ
jgi:hypothetical protein